MTTSIPERGPANVRYGSSAMDGSVAAQKHAGAYQAAKRAAASRAGDWTRRLDTRLASSLSDHHKALARLSADLEVPAGASAKSLASYSSDLDDLHVASMKEFGAEIFEGVARHGTEAGAAVREHIATLRNRLADTEAAIGKAIAQARAAHAESAGPAAQDRLHMLEGVRAKIAAQRSALHELSAMSEKLGESALGPEGPKMGKTAQWFNSHAGTLTALLAVAAFIQAASLIVMAYSQRQIKAQGEKHEKQHVDSGLAVESEGMKARDAALQQLTGQSPIPSNNPLYAGAPANFSAN